MADKTVCQKPGGRPLPGGPAGVRDDVGGGGIFLNLCLFAGKLASGLLSGSIAITADALNNLSDAASSIVTLIGFRMAGRKPDLEHPFGHGRIEYIAGLIVSFIILMMGYELVDQFGGEDPYAGGGHFSLLPAVILAASVLVKLWMAHFNHTLAKAIDSAAMEATAADSRSDAVATTAVLAGTIIGGIWDIPIDGWLGLAVSILILKTGFDAAKDTISPSSASRRKRTLSTRLKRRSPPTRYPRHPRPDRPQLRPRAGDGLPPRRGVGGWQFL